MRMIVQTRKDNKTMFENIKMRIDAAESITNEFKYKKEQLKNSLDYWKSQVVNALENEPETDASYYEKEIKSVEVELEFIEKTEQFLYKLALNG